MGKTKSFQSQIRTQTHKNRYAPPQNIELQQSHSMQRVVNRAPESLRVLPDCDCCSSSECVYVCACVCVCVKGRAAAAVTRQKCWPMCRGHIAATTCWAGNDGTEWNCGET